MSTQSTLLSMSHEILLMIFTQVYIGTKIHLMRGVSLGQLKAFTEYSWVPEEVMAPLVFCEYLRPIALEALFKATLFIMPGNGMTLSKQHSWWTAKPVDNPTDLVRRVQSDFYFARMLERDWGDNLRKLKFLSITYEIMPGLQWATVNPEFQTLQALGRKCASRGVKLNAYITVRGHRAPTNRLYPQSIRLVMREDSSVHIKEVKAVLKTFYDNAKRLIRDTLGQDLEEMVCKRGAKLIKYIDNDLDWQEEAAKKILRV